MSEKTLQDAVVELSGRLAMEADPQERISLQIRIELILPMARVLAALPQNMKSDDFEVVGFIMGSCWAATVANTLAGAPAHLRESLVEDMGLALALGFTSHAEHLLDLGEPEGIADMAPEGRA